MAIGAESPEAGMRGREPHVFEAMSDVPVSNCATCGYFLAGVPLSGESARCPECGLLQRVRPLEVQGQRRLPTGARLYFVAFIPLSLFLTVFAAIYIARSAGWWTLYLPPVAIALVGTAMFHDLEVRWKLWLGWLPLTLVLYALCTLALIFLIARAMPIF